MNVIPIAQPSEQTQDLNPPTLPPWLGYLLLLPGLQDGLLPPSTFAFHHLVYTEAVMLFKSKSSQATSDILPNHCLKAKILPGNDTFVLCFLLPQPLFSAALACPNLRAVARALPSAWNSLVCYPHGSFSHFPYVFAT